MTDPAKASANKVKIKVTEARGTFGAKTARASEDRTAICAMHRASSRPARRNTEDYMNWIKQLLQPKAAVATPNQGDEALQNVGPSEEDKVLEFIRDYFESKGGLASVIKAFEQSGFIGKVRSWVSTGPNQPINSVEAVQLFGRPKIEELAKKADVSVEKFKELLAELLPVAVDRSTPEGKL
jgi:uncharacterized protein YidB (DUF937 family)